MCFSRGRMEVEWRSTSETDIRTNPQDGPTRVETSTRHRRAKRQVKREDVSAISDALVTMASEMVALRQASSAKDSSNPPDVVNVRTQMGFVEKTIAERSGDHHSCLDRERLLNDLTNTGVIGALIGGFALGALPLLKDDATNHDSLIEQSRQCAMTLSVHLCTFAAICSALMYRKANMLADDHTAADFAAKLGFIQHLPFMSLRAGVICYIAGVALTGANNWHSASVGWSAFYSASGAMCLCSILLANMAVHRA